MLLFVSVGWQAKSMSSATSLRKDPPSPEANNQDVFVWALYLLGGADKDVDVEEIYLKCFELAPARLGWRTHPEIPDYKKTSKALQSIEATTHVGLLHRPHKYSRRLTLEGIKWVEAYRSILEKNYSKAIVQASKTTNQHERKRHELKKSDAWAKFLIDPSTVEISDAAAALQCSAASPMSVWSGRVNDLRRTGDLLSDESILNFADFIEAQFISGRKS
jgi:hypothetical protein